MPEPARAPRSAVSKPLPADYPTPVNTGERAAALPFRVRLLHKGAQNGYARGSGTKARNRSLTGGPVPVTDTRTADLTTVIPRLIDDPVFEPVCATASTLCHSPSRRRTELAAAGVSGGHRVHDRRPHPPTGAGRAPRELAPAPLNTLRTEAATVPNCGPGRQSCASRNQATVRGIVSFRQERRSRAGASATEGDALARSRAPEGMRWWDARTLREQRSARLGQGWDRASLDPLRSHAPQAGRCDQPSCATSRFGLTDYAARSAIGARSRQGRFGRCNASDTCSSSSRWPWEWARSWRGLPRRRRAATMTRPSSARKGAGSTSSRNTADTFVNQGDCVNDGAQAHSVFTTAGEAACQQLHDSTFTVGTQHVLWNCQFPNDSQNAGGGDALRQACATDAGPNPLFSLTPLGGDQFFAAECST